MCCPTAGAMVVFSADTFSSPWLIHLNSDTHKTGGRSETHRPGSETSESPPAGRNAPSAWLTNSGRSRLIM